MGIITPEIILGPPGTGKTKNGLDIVEEELTRKTAPERMGYVSFTRKAAKEAVDRAAAQFGFSRDRFRYFRTIHSLCFQQLGLSSGDVMEGNRIVEFGNWLGIELTGAFSLEEGDTFGYLPGDRALFMENMARVRQMPLRELYGEIQDPIPWSKIEWIARSYVEYKKNEGLIDYTDMLQRFVEQNQPPRLDVLIVDEAQDLSLLQWAVIWCLAQHCRRLVIIGDDDQAIYRWAGAAVTYFVQLAGVVRTLNQSWRVPTSPQKVAISVLNQIKGRRPKVWSPRPEEGVVSRAGNINFVDFEGEDILVLARNSFLLKGVASFLRREGMVYEWRGNSSVARPALEAATYWEKLRAGDSVSGTEARRIYELMSAGKGFKRGFKTLPGLADDAMVGLGDLITNFGCIAGDRIWHEALDRIHQDDRMYMIRARKRGEKLRARPRIRLGTIHSSKGGEGDHVVLLTDMAQRTFNEMHRSPEDEHRVWYVGATRCRQKLTLIAPSTRQHYKI